MSMSSENELPMRFSDPDVSRRMWSLKYLIEWLVAIAGTLIMLPLFIVIALIIKLTSQGPVFYVSQRIGKNGKAFRLYKFRTMKVAAEQILATDGKVVTLDDDPRLTPVGKCSSARL